MTFAKFCLLPVETKDPVKSLMVHYKLVRIIIIIIEMMMMAFRQIPHMKKSHHGGNMSLIGEVGFCHRHIPTIDNYDDEVGLGVFVDL